MSVWFAIPSKRPPAEAEPILNQWRAQGYKIALWLDSMDFPYGVVDYIRSGAPEPYPGYAVAVNTLVADVLKTDSECDWIVTGGDDTYPDQNHTADEIARQCSDHFMLENAERSEMGDALQRCMTGEQAQTFGVMQPTGDTWGETGVRRRQIESICGSPWLGREFCRRINQGEGPLWREYTHCWADNELQCVAEGIGILWQRPDLTHYHDHWARAGRERPAFWDLAESTYHTHRALFETRKKMGFPGSKPL